MNDSGGDGYYYVDYLSNESLLAVDLADVFLNPHLHPVTTVYMYIIHYSLYIIHYILYIIHYT